MGRRRTLIIDNTKQCSGCKEWKQLSKFFRHPTNTSGRMSRCKACIGVYQREYSKTGRRKEVLSQSRQRGGRFTFDKGSARRHGHVWLLTKEQFDELIKQSCVYCGLEPSDTQRIGIDRADNNGEYTPSNSVPCCFACNITKGDRFSKEEMLAMIDLVKSVRGGENRGGL